MKTLIISFLISMLAIGNSIAQNSKSVAGNSPTSDRFNLPDSVVKAIDSVFAEYNNTRSPGCAVGVVRGGKLIFSRGYGMASLEHDIPITPQSAFYAASVSKQFTAFAVALLADQGRISLEDDIRVLIPEVPDFGSTIKVRHLLHHTSGLRDYFSLLTLNGWPSDGPVTEKEFLDLVRRQQGLNFLPGSEYLYSNTGYVLLSILVERVIGQSLREFARTKIFEPLDMNHTSFRDDHTMLIRNRALAYTPITEAESGFRLSMPGFDVVGDGGLYTTVQDLARWAENFESQKVGGIRVANMMLTPGVLTSGDTIDYALGLSHGNLRGLNIIGHGGAYGGYRANLMRFPEHDLSVFMLCNRSDASLSSRTLMVAEVFLDEHMEPKNSPTLSGKKEEKERELAPEILDRYAGSLWRVEDVGALLLFSNDSGLLVINDIASSETSTLIALSENIFRLEDGRARIVFEYNTDEATQQATWEGSSGWETSLQRIEPWNPDPDELREFEGLYYSSELNTFYNIVWEDGRLLAKHNRQKDMPLTPAEKDGFGSTYPFVNVQFQRGENGQITGFLVSAGRVKDIRFEKQE